MAATAFQGVGGQVTVVVADHLLATRLDLFARVRAGSLRKASEQVHACGRARTNGRRLRVKWPGLYYSTPRK